MLVCRFLIVALGLLFTFGHVCHASEEEFLIWSEIRIVTPERPDTGKVVFTAKMAGPKFHELLVVAFGKEHKATKEHLEKLSGFPLSSLVTTHEAGYEQLGGHTVHFKLKSIRYDRTGRLVEDRVRLSVSRGKGMEVFGPEQRVLKEKD
ncbi:MAG: hypothetical protein L0215_12185 [Gemmataceae bacterium]|nr:hypothetical protein [Gemmataceae bacterium]